MMKRRLHEILEPARTDDTSSRAFDLFIVWLILLNLVAFIFGTVEPLYERYARAFDTFEYVSVGIFTAEYLGRLWTCTEKPNTSRLRGRFQYAFRPLLIIDLLAILPAILPAVGMDLRVLRVFRIIRLLRVLKLARYSDTIQMFGRILRNKREELITALGFTFVLILLASTVMYYAEHDAQPKAFGSIPATMWWAVATLTTVGYGDVYPITVLGKMCGAIVALLGISLFAVPPGILAAAYEEENTKRMNSRRDPTNEDNDFEQSDPQSSDAR